MFNKLRKGKKKHDLNFMYIWHLRLGYINENRLMSCTMMGTLIHAIMNCYRLVNPISRER